MWTGRPFNPARLSYGAISGMVDALGDTGHSTLPDSRHGQEEKDFTAGKYKGIGAEIR